MAIADVRGDGGDGCRGVAGGGGGAALPAGLGTPLARKMGRGDGELLAALKTFRAEEKLAASLSLFASRLPVWDAERELLTLDYPPGRASVASVQNFQLAALLPRTIYGDGDEEDEEVCSHACSC